LVNLVRPLRLEPSQKQVLWALADAARDPDDQRWPNQAWPPIHGKDGKLGLVELTCLSERTIQRAIRALEGAGHLSRKQVRHGVIYTVHPLTPVIMTPDTMTGDALTPDDMAATPDTVSPKPSRTESSQKASPSSRRARKANFAEPAGVSAEQWASFCAQRKKPLNPRAYQLLCSKLAGLAEAGHDPGDLIDLAIERGWETVWPPRDWAADKPSGWGDFGSGGKRSAWAAKPGMAGLEPASLDDPEYWLDRAEAADRRAASAESFGRFDDAARADARNSRIRAAALLQQSDRPAA